jgi:hypothetical protein
MWGGGDFTEDDNCTQKDPESLDRVYSGGMLCTQWHNLDLPEQDCGTCPNPATDWPTQDFCSKCCMDASRDTGECRYKLSMPADPPPSVGCEGNPDESATYIKPADLTKVGLLMFDHAARCSFGDSDFDDSICSTCATGEGATYGVAFCSDCCIDSTTKGKCRV